MGSGSTMGEYTVAIWPGGYAAFDEVLAQRSLTVVTRCGSPV